MYDFDPIAGLGGLFLSAFVSATVAPGGSEAVLAYLVDQAQISVSLLLLVATLGNTLGALTTWLLGTLARTRYPVERMMPKGRRKAIYSLRRWGVAALFLSWLPVVGDAFCFAGGWLRLPFLPSLVAIATGKALRYWLVASVFAV